MTTLGGCTVPHHVCILHKPECRVLGLAGPVHRPCLHTKTKRSGKCCVGMQCALWLTCVPSSSRCLSVTLECRLPKNTPQEGGFSSILAIGSSVGRQQISCFLDWGCLPACLPMSAAAHACSGVLV